MSSNIAAWNTALGAPFEVKPAPLGIPRENEILVKNHAIAINPADGKVQYTVLYPMTYPTILGEDVSGEVVAVGPGVTRFKIGDRVAGFAVGSMTKRHEEQAFQAYTVLKTNMSSEIPDHIPFENAAVIGLGLSTAAQALFSPDCLGLRLPTAPKQNATGKTVLIWGGASSVGSNAIQLTVAAGYEVITTASPKNFNYVKKLGATEVFDYNSPTVTADIVAAFEKKTSAGAFDCIGPNACDQVFQIAQQIDGVKAVATVYFGSADVPGGVTRKGVLATLIKDSHIGKALWEDFLPKALEVGSFVPAPEPLVVGTGLEKLQEAVDLVRQGVSAKKVVVVL